MDSSKTDPITTLGAGGGGVTGGSFFRTSRYATVEAPVLEKTCPL